jgi:hypothetical protein
VTPPLKLFTMTAVVPPAGKLKTKLKMRFGLRAACRSGKLKLELDTPVTRGESAIPTGV